jgi:Tat protein secretion system quality control protein TatD with DNase activity
MSERNILAAAVLDRRAYELLQVHMDSRDFTPLGQYWLEKVDEYYNRDTVAKSCEISTLRSLGLQSAGAQHEETLAGFFDSLPIVGASPSNIVATILQHKRNQVGIELAQILSDPSHESQEASELVETYRELCIAVDTGNHPLDVVDYDTLGEFFSPDKVIPLFPKKVWRTRLLGGGAQPGHHILIYGRTEQGKTLFAIYQASAIASAGYKVLYIANEEAAEIHATRAACAFTGCSIEMFSENQAEILARAKGAGLDRITFIRMEPGTFPEVEQAIRTVEPDVIIVDQLAGLDTGESNPVIGLDLAARRFRTLLSTYGLVGISVHQAGDRTERHGQEPPAWLTLSDVYSSRTGLPAQCDLMIGIGSDEEMRYKNQRAIALPKNKIGGNHEGFLLRFDEKRTRCHAV